MGADYFVKRNCPVQTELGDDAFLAAMVQRRQSALFSGEILVDGKPFLVTTPKDGLPVRTLRDGHVAETTITREAASQLDAEMATFERNCEGCPANPSGDSFGCYGFLGYPIRRVSEEWLVRRAMNMGVGALFAVSVLDKMGVSGDHVADLRGRGGTFFESSEPTIGGWSLKDGTEVAVSSDILVELGLFRLPEDPSLTPLAAILFGLVSPAVATPQALAEWMADATSMAPHLIAPDAGADPDQGGFVLLFERLVAAAKGSFGLVVDG